MNAERVAGERLLTARDLETWLKIDAKTIYVYAKQKRIPHIKIGTNIRFPEREVRAWLQSHAHSASFPRKQKQNGHRKTRRSRR
jgi:excisionase family DNA binding protein